MLRRKILDTLREWKGSHGTECLLVNGARQVGKSFAIEAFGRAEYESYIAIVFMPMTRACSWRCLTSA